jgi:hypothetical protein
MVTKTENGFHEVGLLNLDTFTVSWIDAWDESETQAPYEIQFDSAGESGVTKLTVTSNGLFKRFRWIDLANGHDGRWLTESAGLIEDVAFMGPQERFVVSILDQWSSPKTYSIQSYEWSDGTAIELDQGALSPYDSVQNLVADTTRGLSSWQVGDRRWSVPSGGGTRIDLTQLAIDAGTVPNTGSVVQTDETGKAHWFFNSGDATWRMDIDGLSAPIEIAGSTFTRILAIHDSSQRVIFQGPEQSNQTNIYPVYTASLTGEGSREIGHRAYVVWSTPGPECLTLDGSRFLFRNTDHRLVLVELDQPESAPRVISDQLPLTGSASLGTISPDRRWVMYQGSSDVESHGIYLAPISGGAPVYLAGGSYPFWATRWTEDGRFFWFSLDSSSTWKVVDTNNSFNKIEVPKEFYDRLVGITPDNRAVHARGSVGLTFYTTDLATGETKEVCTLPVPTGPFSQYANFGEVSPDSSWLAVLVDTKVWLISLEEGEPRILTDAETLGSGIGILGIDAEAVYISTYEDAIYALPLDGSAIVQLTEERPVSNGVVGVTNVRLDFERRILVYASSYPDGVRRLYRRTLDEPAAEGYAGEIFPLEIWNPQMQGGVVVFLFENGLWVIDKEKGSTPRLLTAISDGRYLYSFELSADARHVLVLVVGRSGDAIYRVLLSNGSQVRLTPPLSEGRSISGYTAGAEEHEVLFSANLEGHNVTRIYRSHWSPNSTGGDGLDHPGYAAWIVDENLPAGQEAPGEDADQDGFSNLLEYIHRTSGNDQTDVPGFRLDLVNTGVGQMELT